MPHNDDFDLKGRRVWVAGHRGMVGSALVRRLRSEGCEILIVAPRESVDLTRQEETEDWLAAGASRRGVRRGGARSAASWPTTRGRRISSTTTSRSRPTSSTGRIGWEWQKLVFLGSSCIYPRHAPQPMTEDSLLTGPLEPTNQWYAIAKIAGHQDVPGLPSQYGCDFISAMPTNLYGPGDNFDLAGSHVVPALLRKAHEAKLAGGESLGVWGSGQPRREFLYVDDCADAVVHLAKHYSGEAHVNVGTGEDVSIAELAEMVCRVVGFDGKLSFDRGMPEGMPRKLLDVTRLRAIGWHHGTPLEEGLRRTYAWFLEASEGTELRRGSTTVEREVQAAFSELSAAMGVDGVRRQ